MLFVPMLLSLSSLRPIRRSCGPCLRCWSSRGFLSSTRRVGVVCRSSLVEFSLVSMYAPPLVRAPFIVVAVARGGGGPSSLSLSSPCYRPPRRCCRLLSLSLSWLSLVCAPLPVVDRPGSFCRLRRASLGSSFSSSPLLPRFLPQSWSSWSWLALPLSRSSWPPPPPLLLPSLLVSLPLFLSALVSFLSFPRFSSSLASSGAGSGLLGCCGGGGGGLVVVVIFVVVAAAAVVVGPWRWRRPRLVL